MAPDRQIQIARQQLGRVQQAWREPDWSDLYIYGFYAMENAVVAAAEHFGLPWKPNHLKKAELARRLHQDYGLPDIWSLLRELNEFRKGTAYGEALPESSYTAEDLAYAIEGYVEKVAAMIEGGE